MNILLLGYGKMGRTIEKIADNRKHSIIGRIDNSNESRDAFNKENTDVAIEFSQPEAAKNNIKWCLEEGIPVISGTTGWLEDREEIEKLCKSKDGTFFYASNFSVGVNIFFQLNKYLAKLMDPYDDYKIAIEETHHKEKKDAPSGTAISLAEDIVDNIQRIRKQIKGKTSNDEEVGISSLREEDIPGTHKIQYQSKEDQIEIIHTAHSREGFALGAVLVAEWISGKKGVLGMKDYLNFEKI